ncbi:DNA-binding transcription factor [Lithospermum erythrorhizon]|uniref:DNA-binding transcription factor n=1 Tax=Lithospermum erythrorhizon TaxID=34254 RepID=A0AAV3RXU0_LITER
MQQQREHNLRQQLLALWAKQSKDSDKTTDFKNHSLPLARIKKIMKADEDVRMISAEAPIVFARACEMFIVDLTLRSWNHTEDTKRRTLQRNDIADAITSTEIFDFLVDIVPKEEEENGGVQDEASHNNNFVSLAPPPRGTMPLGAPYSSNLYGYCYMPPPQSPSHHGPLDLSNFTHKSYDPYLPPLQMSTQVPQQSKSSSDS